MDTPCVCVRSQLRDENLERFPDGLADRAPVLLGWGTQVVMLSDGCRAVEQVTPPKQFLLPEICFPRRRFDAALFLFCRAEKYIKVVIIIIIIVRG